MARRVVGPDRRVEGGDDRSGYWQKDYTVLEVGRDARGVAATWTVVYAGETGRITHSTAWDWRRDRVVSTPEPWTSAA